MSVMRDCFESRAASHAMTTLPIIAVLVRRTFKSHLMTERQGNREPQGNRRSLEGNNQSHTLSESLYSPTVLAALRYLPSLRLSAGLLQWSGGGWGQGCEW